METHNSMQSFSQGVQCIYCNKILKHKYTLNRHIKVVHVGAKSYQCECGKSFTTREQFTRHYNAKHTDLKPFPCEMGCDRSFASYPARDYHHKAVHGGLKYYCPICWKQYSTKTHVKNHFYTHHYCYLMPHNYINFT